MSEAVHTRGGSRSTSREHRLGTACAAPAVTPPLPARAGLGHAPVLSWSWSSLSPRSATFVMFSLMMPTVSSICAWMAAVFEFPAPAGFEEEPPRGKYGSYGSDLQGAHAQTRRQTSWVHAAGS